MRGIERRSIHTVGLGPNRGGTASSHGSHTAPLTSRMVSSMAPGVPVVPTSEHHRHRAPMDRPPTSKMPPFPLVGALCRRSKAVRVCSGLVGRYSGRLAGRFLRGTDGLMEPCEPAVASQFGPRPTVCIQRLSLPHSLWRDKENGVGCRVKPLRAATKEPSQPSSQPQGIPRCQLAPLAIAGHQPHIVACHREARDGAGGGHVELGGALGVEVAQ